MLNLSRYTRSRRKTVRKLLEVNGLDLELFFATEILGLHSLHYGYWDTQPGEEELTLASLREAQARFTDRLLARIPAGVVSILDVGAGIGDNARALSARGYHVTSISPDKNHCRYFQDIPGVTFHQSKFEDFASEECFDLIFISEALNYFDPARGLEQCRRYLREAGRVLIAGMFRFTSDTQPFPKDFMPADLPYVHQARDHGFSLCEAVDVTPNVLPTMEMIHAALKRHAQPTTELLDHFLTGSAPVKAWILKKVFSRQLQDLGRIRSYYERRTDPLWFQRSIRYMILLLGRSHASGSQVR